MINRYPTISKTKVIVFIEALTVGNIETSREPSIPSGLGPKIRKGYCSTNSSRNYINYPNPKIFTLHTNLSMTIEQKRSGK